MKKKVRGSSRHGTLKWRDFDFHPDRIAIDADEYKEAIRWIGNQIEYYSGNGDVTEDKTFLPWFEFVAVQRLVSAGFKRKILEDKRDLDKIINVLSYQGMISPNCERIPLQNHFPRGTFTTSEDNLIFRVDIQIEAALRTLKSIQALKQLLVNDAVVSKEAMKVYLLSLDLMINQTRAGHLGGLATQQLKKPEEGKKGGKKSGEVRREKAAPILMTRQAEAGKIWLKHPTWKNKRVAEKIVKRHGGNIDTVRRTIKKPLP